MPSPGSGTRLRELVLTLLLVLSGSAALMHQAAWFRLLMPVLGVGVLSAAAVSAGALLGLALGSLIGGRLADRSGRPGLVFAGAELCAALACLGIPLGTRLVAALAHAFPPEVASGATTTLRDIVGTLCAVLVCTVAAIPMGATLPSAVRALDAPRSSVGAAFRRLYGWNTVGAVVGVGLAVGVLLEDTGNHGLILVASAVQAAIGIVAVLLFRRRSAAPPSAEAAAPIAPRRALGWAAFLAGGAGLAVQVAWVRRITPVVGNTTYAFAAVLGTYLLALALGSLLLGPRRGRGETRGPLRVLVLAAIPVAILPFAIGAVGLWTVGLLQGRVPGQLELIGIQSAATGMLLVPSTLIGAAALPWLVRAAAPRPEQAGRSAGRLLFMNTAGSALFALLTALVWLPLAGSAGVLRGAAGTYLGAGALLAKGVGRSVLGVLAALLFLQPLLLPVEDKVLWDVVGATFSPEHFNVDDAPRRYAEEGRVSTVVVRDREGRPELWVDSKIVASVGATDRLHLALLGHLPMALHPDPKHVAVIGLGTGITSTAAATWAPETLHVFELEPAVQGAAEYFRDHGGGLPERATLVLRDGRQGIAHSDRHYDVVTSDPIHPGVAGAAALYGKDHYEMLKERSDIVCQWLPLYQMAMDDVRMVVRTFAAVFEHPYVFLAGPDALLVGSAKPLEVDEAALRDRLAGAPGADLAAYGLGAPGRLLGLLVQGPKGARLFAGDGELNTDDHLRLEFRCGRHWYLDEMVTVAQYLRLGRTTPDSLLGATASTAFEEEVRQATQFHRTMRVWMDGDYARAAEEFEAARAWAPGNGFALEMQLESLIFDARELLDDALDRDVASDVELAVGTLRSLAARPELDALMRLDIAAALMDAGQLADARRIAAPLAANPGWPRARRILGDGGGR